MARVAHELGKDGYWSIDQGTYGHPVVTYSYDNAEDALLGVNPTKHFHYKDDVGNYWQEVYHPDGTFELQTTNRPGDSNSGWREAEEGEEPMGHISQGQQAPPPGDDLSDKTLSDFRTQPTYVPPKDPMYTLPDPPDRLPPEPEPPDRLPPEPTGSSSQAQEKPVDPNSPLLEPPNTPPPDPPDRLPPEPEPPDRLPPEPEPPPPAQGGPQNPPRGDEGDIPGFRVPFLDFIPSFFPIGQDPATGEWRYEHGHDPDLAKKWAEERGIEPPPQPPASPSEQAQYLDLAKKWAEDLGIKLPPLPPEQAPGGTQNPPPAPEEVGNRANDGYGGKYVPPPVPEEHANDWYGGKYVPPPAPSVQEETTLDPIPSSGPSPLGDSPVEQPPPAEQPPAAEQPGPRDLLEPDPLPPPPPPPP